MTFVDPAEAGRQHSRRVVRGGTRERRRKIAGRGLESLCESAEYRSASWKHRFLHNFVRAAIFPVVCNSFEPGLSKSRLEMFEGKLEERVEEVGKKSSRFELETCCVNG